MAFNILISILVWGTSAVVLLSILFTGGMPFPSFLTNTDRKKKTFSFLDKSQLCEKTDTLGGDIKIS